MKKILHHASCRFEILSRHGSALPFRDMPSTMRFLRLFKRDPFNMATLRAYVAAGSHYMHRLNDEAVLKNFAFLLMTGRTAIIQSTESRGWMRTQSAQEAGQGEAEGLPKSMIPKSMGWVEINLRDEKGKPVAGERYRIRLPDGSVREGILDAFGHAEYSEISRGRCEVSFPDLEDEEWSKA